MNWVNGKNMKPQKQKLNGIKQILVKLKFSFIIFLMFSFIGYSKNYNSHAKVIRVIDGDTISVKLKRKCIPDIFKYISIRFRYVNTPELHSKNKVERVKALKAKNFVINKLKNKNVWLTNCVKGKYFRLVCEVYYKNKNKYINLNKQILNNKLGVYYDVH